MNMNFSSLHKPTDSLKNTPKMPVLFLGHGSPMNAIEENEFVKGFRKMSSEFESPNAIICISAHWETPGTKITAMENPRTIHDFGGFPRALYEVQYPAPGHPVLAKDTRELVVSTNVELDDTWGLDHGAWIVIKHMYPNASVPIIQLSLDFRKSPREHYVLAQELINLRNKGVLLIGSGNLVHNLGQVDWNRINDYYAYDWAQEAGEKMNRFILEGNHEALIKYKKHGRPFELSIPTPEHYLPLLYVLALQEKGDSIELFNDKPLAGSLSMTSVKLG
jgi:4,5-DOPA dioxygenase extradiol